MSAARSRLARALAVLGCLALAAPAACKRGAPTASTDPAPAPLVVKADTENLLLTWVDDKGDFHVETRVADVPMTGRDAVRVVDPNREEGLGGDRVLLVDLRTPGADGAFPVRAATRAEFEALAVARREKAGPTLASAAPAPPPPPGASAAAADPVKPAARPAVIIYGAEWCGACHDAARYLKAKGIPYVEKDVEKDPAAAREMQDKLAKNGLHAGSIPVLDVRGHVMVGFSAQQVEGALGAAL